MGVMDDSVDRESSDHKWDSYQKHCIKVVTKLSGCCIDENRSVTTSLKILQAIFIGSFFNTLFRKGSDEIL